MTKRYQIALSSPLGERRGTLLLQEDDGVVTGTISLLNADNPVTGRRDGDTVYLTHHLRTLLNQLSCTTELHLSGDAVTGVTQVGNMAAMALRGTELPPEQ